MEEIKLDVRKITERKLRFKSVKKEKGKRRTKKGCCLSILFAACFCFKGCQLFELDMKTSFIYNPGGNALFTPFNYILLRFLLLLLFGLCVDLARHFGNALSPSL